MKKIKSNIMIKGLTYVFSRDVADEFPIPVKALFTMGAPLPFLIKVRPHMVR